MIAAALVVTPAGAQSLDQAREQRRAVQARLDSAAEDLAAIERQVAILEAERVELTAERKRIRRELTATSERIDDRVRELFKRGTADPVMLLLSSSEPTEAVQRAVTIQQLVAGDRVDAEVAGAARVRLGVVSDQLADREGRLADVRSRQRDRLEQLHKDLEVARSLETRLEREAAERAAAAAARRRAEAAAAAAARSATSTVSRAQPSGGTACPIGRPHSFTDTWGAPRGSGRRHQGVDMLAPYGTPIYAIVSGIWDARPYGSSAGNWAMLRGSDGNVYYYMHLQSHTVSDGARVSAGQQTGTNGDTGNARGTPHLHFEYHPGGGGPVNPYPLVSRVC